VLLKNQSIALSFGKRYRTPELITSENNVTNEIGERWLARKFENRIT
jgi:hypothetical protein